MNRWSLRSLRVPLAATALVTGLTGACGPAESVVPPSPEAGCAPVLENGGGDRVQPPDGPASCPPGECNYQTQRGCADGEACRPATSSDRSSIEPTCHPAGTKARGEPCTEFANECVAGHVCVSERCRKLCCGGDWSACSADESCIRELHIGVADAAVPAEVSLCMPVNDCNVLDPDACSDGKVCRLVDPTGNVACAAGSSLGLGDRCDASQQCGPLLHCVNGKCRRLCNATDCGEPGCPEEEGVCVHFDRDPRGVGECTPGYEKLARENP